YVIADSKRSDLLPRFFVYSSGGECFYHGVQMGRVVGTEFFDLQSAYGYGGPLSSSDATSFLEEAWRNYRTWCEANRVLAEFVRFHPLLENWRFYWGEVVSDRETVWIDLTRPDTLAEFAVRART